MHASDRPKSQGSVMHASDRPKSQGSVMHALQTLVIWVYQKQTAQRHMT